jgi:dihydrofolate reductase
MRECDMRKLVVGTFISLDGVMQGPGAADEDRDGGFERGGWVVPYIGDEFMARVTEEVGQLGALLLGRKTYDVFAVSWPLRGDEDPVAAKLNSVPKYVASRTLEKAEWNNSTILSGDVAKAVAELKQQPGDGEIQVHGSCELIQTLVEHDLVDEFHLRVFPVLVGPGKRLFGAGTVPAGLELTATAATSTGVLINTYTRAGKLEYGAIGPETGNW